MKKSELIKIIKEELTSILSEQAPRIINFNGMPGIDTGKTDLADAQIASRTLGDILRSHLQKSKVEYDGTHFKRNSKGSIVLVAYKGTPKLDRF